MVLIEEDCSLCGATYPYRALYRCIRCGRLYCRNCFVFDEEGKVICLKCAARRVSPPVHGSKYASLSIFLARRAKYSNYVTLPFAEIEDIIGERLPFSAKNYKHWWSNIRNRSPSEAWLTVGWSVQNVDFEKKAVAFKKDKPTPIQAMKARRKRRREPVSASFKALAAKRRIRKPRESSKTKIAMALARMKNIENREVRRKYKGKLKPKGAYEKRLYGSEAKSEEAA